MVRQNETGKTTEARVRDKLEELGLEVREPVPDRGVDFVVTSKSGPDRRLLVQVKGRGKDQKNRKYRWFQIRTTKRQREEAVRDGLPLCEAWRKKVALVDVFVFVSERYQEFWIFEASEIENLIFANRAKYGNRKDNLEGRQAEIDLDVKQDGVPLTEMFERNRNNWEIITDKLS